MRVIVIGAGGVGGWLTAGLAATLAHTKDIPADADRQLVIVDGDHFEPKNMARQHFQAMGNKASIRTQELTPLYPGVDIIDMPMWVVEEVPEGANDGDDSVEENTKAIAAKDLLAEEDIVFTVVDNFAARATVIAAAAELDHVDVILAGNDDAWFASMYHYQRRDGADVTDNPLWKPELAEPSDRNPGELSCAERAAIDGGTQNIWTNMLAAAIGGSRFVNTILRGNRPAEADEIYHDLDLGRALGFDRSAAAEAPASESAEAPSAEEHQPA